MYINDFSDCCTARIIQNWPYDEVNIWRNGKREEQTYEQWAKKTRGYLLACVGEMNEDEAYSYGGDDEDREDKYRDMRNLALIFATLTSEQQWSIRFAKEVGFKFTRRVRKGRHPERTLVGLWISGKNLYKWSLNNGN